MEENKDKTLSDLFTEAKSYLETRIEYTRFFVLKLVAKLIGDIVTNSIALICFVLAFILGSITLAFFLASLFHSYTAGFGCVTLLYLLIAMLVFATKNNFIEKAIVNLTIKKYFKTLQENNDDEEKV
jgi:hypothetical protein